MPSMTVPNQVNQNQYTGTGTDSTYEYTFRIFSASDLIVTTMPTTGIITTLVLNTDYTVDGVLSYTGGVVTLLAGNLPTGTILTITRDAAEVQQTSLRNQSSYNPGTVEDALDLLTMEVQTLRRMAQSSLRVPLGDSQYPINTFPSAALRANSFVAFDGTGEAIVTSGAAGIPVLPIPARTVIANDTGSTALATATSIDGLTVLSTGSTTRRSLGARFSDIVNVKDFGAKGDGTTDDTTAIQAAMTAGAGGMVWFPEGRTFLISAVLNMANNTTYTGGGTLKAANSANISTAMLYGNAVSNVIVEKLVLDGNKANTGSNYGIRFAGGTNNKISTVYVHDTIQAGGYLDAENGSSILNSYWLNNGQAGPTDNHGIMVISISAIQLKNILISGNVVDNAYRKAITVYSASPGSVDGVRVVDNSVVNGGLGGIYCANAPGGIDQKNIVIANNTAINCYVGIEATNISGGLIASNSIRASGSSGIQVVDCTNMPIVGNHVEDSQVRGIFVTASVTGSTNIIVSNNTVRRSNRSTAGFGPGIGLAGAEFCTVTGNRISDDGAKQTHAIYEEAPGNNNTISENLCTNATTGILVVVTGASSRFDGPVGTNYGYFTAAPNNTLHINGGISTTAQALALVNGANNNVTLPARAGFLYVTGPTGVFNVTGIAGGVDGRRITIHNYTTLAMTLTHSSGGSSVGNKILCTGAVDLVVAQFGAVEMVFNPSANAWCVLRN